ncbi:unnamed protein product [Blepharisma stoltei]|uniref:Uncharacterized protein n=1 Tax=Blepharisma stoltei TaxID=1481888 RepID=A0AAU9K8E9_9CILI|nr:unnamed protein product [Blepharisma stoltei]
MQSFPQTKRPEDLRFYTNRAAHLHLNGKKRFFMHKNSVSPDYALAQDDYTNFLIRSARMDINQIKDNPMLSPSRISGSIQNFEDYDKFTQSRSVSQMESPVRKIKISEIGIQTEKNKESLNEREETGNLYLNLKPSPSLNALPTFNKHEKHRRNTVRNDFSSPISPYAAADHTITNKNKEEQNIFYQQTPKHYQQYKIGYQNPFPNIPASDTLKFHSESPYHSPNANQIFRPQNQLISNNQSNVNNFSSNLSNFGSMLIKPTNFR